MATRQRPPGLSISITRQGQHARTQACAYRRAGAHEAAASHSQVHLRACVTPDVDGPSKTALRTQRHADASGGDGIAARREESEVGLRSWLEGRRKSAQLQVKAKGER